MYAVLAEACTSEPQGLINSNPLAVTIIGMALILIAMSVGISNREEKIAPWATWYWVIAIPGVGGILLLLAGLAGPQVLS